MGRAGKEEAGCEFLRAGVKSCVGTTGRPRLPLRAEGPGTAGTQGVGPGHAVAIPERVKRAPSMGKLRHRPKTTGSHTGQWRGPACSLLRARLGGEDSAIPPEGDLPLPGSPRPPRPPFSLSDYRQPCSEFSQMCRHTPWEFTVAAKKLIYRGHPAPSAEG